MEGEETFDSSLLGSADEVVEERISNDDVSLILRGANDYMLDEMERALHDAFSIVKRTLESNTVLAVNAAKDSTDLVSKLRACHNTQQTKTTPTKDKKEDNSRMGLDLLNGKVRNNLKVRVIEPAMSKVKIIQFATEADITILQIDDMIRLVNYLTTLILMMVTLKVTLRRNVLEMTCIIRRC